MSWWEIALIVWLGGDIFLSLNHLIRTKRANLVPFTLGVVVQSFYDSLFWPIFLIVCCQISLSWKKSRLVLLWDLLASQKIMVAGSLICMFNVFL